MKENCDCKYCIYNVNEFFCLSCGNNFNSCESFFEFYDPLDLIDNLPSVGIQLCPLCYPENKIISPINIKKKFSC